MELTLTSKHELLGTGYFIGIDSENLSEQLIITIEPEELLDKWAYIEFQVNDGEKYNTPRLDIIENKITYDIPNGLLQKGYVTIQIVFRDNDKVIWKSFKKKFYVSDAINACQGLPEEYPDFITEAQILLDEVSIDAAKIDNVIETEQLRVIAEEVRVANENARVLSENVRNSAETTRADKEVERSTNEATRQSNEVSRVNAETTREAKFNTWENTLGVLDNLSNALKNTASGEVIRVDDVSPVEHNAKVKVQGKNLLPNTVKDLSNWTEVGITTQYIFSLDFISDGKYTISGKVDNIIDKYFYIQKSSDNWKSNITTHIITPQINEFPYTFTKEKGFDYRLFWYGVGFNEILDLQIEKGDTATEYTPYIDPASVTVTRCGKNLVRYPFIGFDCSNADELAIADNGDGGVRLNGTVTKDTFVNVGVYQLPGLGSIFPTSTHGFISNKYNETVWTSYDSSNSIVFILVKEGSVLNDVVFYPQIEVGSTSTSFEPYKGETYTPNADGTLSITSTAPTMTLLTDKSGVNIDLEYNQDINKVIKSLQDKINALK